jgi:hypothetical protein
VTRWSSEQRKLYAMAKARERRRAELEPLRTAVDDAICAVGWRRARPVVEEIMGFPVPRQRGAWWSRVGRRNGTRLLTELIQLRDSTPCQPRLWDHDHGPGAA